MRSRLGAIPRQGGKFVFVGIVNNVVGYSLFLLLVSRGVAPIAAMTVSYAVGLAISFMGNRRWTFSHTGSPGKALARFMAANALSYSVNFLILAVLVEGLGWPHAPVQLGAMAVVAAMSFGLMRLWVFADAGAGTHDPGLEPAEAEEPQLS